jgi:hypothetical protein
MWLLAHTYLPTELKISHNTVMEIRLWWKVENFVFFPLLLFWKWENFVFVRT